MGLPTGIGIIKEIASKVPFGYIIINDDLKKSTLHA
jgi:hypothetical protein